MSSCETFRARYESGSEAPAVLEHIRVCDRCLDFVAQDNPDLMFRALGGGEMIPQGGVDAFVDDVMQQVRVRGAESTVEAHPAVSWPRRLAVAATLVAGISGSLLYQQAMRPTPGVPMSVARGIAPVAAKKLATKPVVETYESENATIVEMPSEGAADDVKIVMIFDENLPADL
jgi:hypothetical protein